MSAALLLLVFTIQLAHTALVYVWYFANKTYVATVLCENKDNKKMHCNGKCYLKKKISQAEQQSEKQDAVPVKKAVEQVPFIVKESKETFIYTSLTPVSYSLFRQQYNFTLSKDIFHPPTSVFS